VSETPVVGDVFVAALPRIIGLTEQFWREENARDLVDGLGDYSYVCFKCWHRHYLWSKVGQRHRSQAAEEETK